LTDPVALRLHLEDLIAPPSPRLYNQVDSH